MRKVDDPQQQLQYVRPNRKKQQELWMIDQILNDNPRMEQAVLEDLVRECRTQRGAPGMTAAQVLRCALLKQIYQWSYETLCERIDDSERLRCFTRIGDGEVPGPSTLNDNLKKLRMETLGKVHGVLLEYARHKKVENGKVVRIDSTGVESNIHYPTDNSLLWDGIRVLTRLLAALQEEFGEPVGRYADHTRAAKRRHYRINNSRNEKKRKAAYKELLSIAQQVVGDAREAREHLNHRLKSGSYLERLTAQVFVEELQDTLPLIERCIDQCRRRVLEGQKVAAGDKVVSLFEPHADIIEKGQRETLFGHKICLTGGKSNLILDCLIERGNPSDTQYFLSAIENVEKQYGKVPKQVVTDGGFYSRDNVEKAKGKGIQDVLLAKGPKNELTKHVKSAWVLRKLRKFRAGIEGCISALKRAAGLARCCWSGWESFQSYVWLCVLSFNFQTLARALIEKAG